MISDELYQHIVSIRRQLHEYPELRFDLPRTVSLVRAELDRIGIPYSERFAPCSVVGYLGNDPAKKTLALRADMDALPVEEKTDVPFRSKIPGQMHACGHDTHTAILLGVAEILKSREKELPCNVRFFFQPSEEGTVSGAKMMTDNGVMEGVDAVVCTHCDTTINPWSIGMFNGWYMAAHMSFDIIFHGRTSHAVLPEKGVNAIRMAHEAYLPLEDAVREEANGKRYIWSVGVIQGGTARNIIPDRCEMKATFRFFDPGFAGRVKARIGKICAEIAARYGGTSEIITGESSKAVYNDPELSDQFREIIGNDPELHLVEMSKRMGSEDFCWYLQKAPGFLFRFGIGNDALGTREPGHGNFFKVDEEGMKAAVQAFVDYVMNFG